MYENSLDPDQPASYKCSHIDKTSVLDTQKNALCKLKPSGLLFCHFLVILTCLVYIKISSMSNMRVNLTLCILVDFYIHIGTISKGTAHYTL